MDRHIKDIAQCRVSESPIAISRADNAERDYGSSIVLIPEYFDACPSITELSNALSKRLHTQQLCSIAIGCICSHGYTLNHVNTSGYQCRVFMSIWGHLETLKKSSSTELSQWLSKCLGQRSQEGYNFKFNGGYQANSSGMNSSEVPYRKRFNVRAIPIGTIFSERYFGQADTVRDAMVADTIALSTIKFVFNEPILKNETITRNWQQ